MPEHDSAKNLEEIYTLLSDPQYGLQEIKCEVRKIEERIESLDCGLKEITRLLAEIVELIREIIDILRPPVSEERVNIVVKPGDTLSFFAKVFEVTVEEILALNPGILDPDIIFPGQILSIPAHPPVGPDPGITPAQHLVRAGDTLFLIARQYGLTIDLLLGVNPQITDPDEIFVGQVINLPITPPSPPAPPAGTIQIYVTTAETLTSIAERIGVTLQAIMDSNPQIEDPHLIFVGQIINVPIAS